MMSTLLSRLPRQRCRRALLHGGSVLAMAMLAACTPDGPEKERPPEPQAAQHTEMRDAIQAPIERARQVEADTLEAAAAQRAAIDAATDG